MKKKIVLIIFIALLALAIVATIGGYLFQQASLLKNHYPVWDFKENAYVLVKKKPKSWIKLKSVSPEALWAIVISEDWAFYNHPGIDLNQLEVAVEESIEAQKLVRGASTITQQVVKNALLDSERSLIRKATEILLALIVERELSKNQILEHYINLIELGPDLYGIQNASYYYFKKPALFLNAKEGAFLAMLLPSPRRYSQSFRQRKLTDFASTQVSSILLKLKKAKKITEERREELELESLSFETIAEDIFSSDLDT